VIGLIVLWLLSAWLGVLVGSVGVAHGVAGAQVVCTVVSLLVQGLITHFSVLVPTERRVLSATAEDPFICCRLCQEHSGLAFRLPDPCPTGLVVRVKELAVGLRLRGELTLGDHSHGRVDGGEGQA
jgi:hypothetical protein